MGTLSENPPSEGSIEQYTDSSVDAQLIRSEVFIQMQMYPPLHIPGNKIVGPGGYHIMIYEYMLLPEHQIYPNHPESVRDAAPGDLFERLLCPVHFTPSGIGA